MSDASSCPAGGLRFPAAPGGAGAQGVLPVPPRTGWVLSTAAGGVGGRGCPVHPGHTCVLVGDAVATAAATATATGGGGGRRSTAATPGTTANRGGEEDHTGGGWCRVRGWGVLGGRCRKASDLPHRGGQAAVHGGPRVCVVSPSLTLAHTHTCVCVHISSVSCTCACMGPLVALFFCLPSQSPPVLLPLQGMLGGGRPVPCDHCVWFIPPVVVSSMFVCMFVCLSLSRLVLCPSLPDGDDNDAANTVHASSSWHASDTSTGIRR